MRLGALRRWDSRLRRHRSALVPEAGKYPGELCRVLETPEHWARHQGAVFDRGEADLGEGTRGGCAAPASVRCGVGRLDPALPGISREAGCAPRPQWGGTTRTQSTGWTGGTAEADRAWGRGSSSGLGSVPRWRSVCVVTLSFSGAQDCFPPWGAFP